MRRTVKPDIAFPFHQTHVHPRRNPPEPTPAFFWPLVSLLLSISVSLLCWAAYNALPEKSAGGEKHLRQTLLSSKFNPASAAARHVDIPELLPEPELDQPAAIAKVTGEPPLLPQPAMAMAMPWPITTQAPPSLPKAELVPVSEPVPPLVPPLLPPAIDLLPAALTAAPIVPDQVADVSPLIYRELTPGETPMLRNWKTLALCSLLTTTVFVQVPALRR